MLRDEPRLSAPGSERDGLAEDGTECAQSHDQPRVLGGRADVRDDRDIRDRDDDQCIREECDDERAEVRERRERAVVDRREIHRDVEREEECDPRDREDDVTAVPRLGHSRRTDEQDRSPQADKTHRPAHGILTQAIPTHHHHRTRCTQYVAYPRSACPTVILWLGETGHRLHKPHENA